jgi:GT2 family glycosyltransferase
MTTTVIIVTLNRPDCVRECLTRLARQTPLPDQTVVVDASRDDRTKRVTAEFPGVLYLRNENGFGRMTASRNIGLRVATGDVIAFVDDDAFAHDGWLAALLDSYAADPAAGAVGGRALNDQPGEATQGVDRIGRMLPDGTHTGNFAADPGRTIEVDHVMGCNMSYRRDVLARLGGFREDYPGISGVREDTDMSLRVKALGYKILFNPACVVDHIGAPQSKGQRFDLRYEFYSNRNHTVMLVRNYGLASARTLRYGLWVVKQSAVTFAKRAATAVLRPGATLLGAVVGLGSSLKFVAAGRDPCRHDGEAEQLRQWLSHAAPPRAPDPEKPLSPSLAVVDASAV